MAFNIQIGSPNDALQRAKRFQLPQYQTPSYQVNQANSEVMQGAESTPSNDIYSGAKQGVERIKTALPTDSQPTTQDTSMGSTSFNRGAEMVNDANAGYGHFFHS